MVSEPIRWSLPPAQVNTFKFPVYETIYKSYEGLALIEVSIVEPSESDEKQRFVFHSFRVPSDEASLGTLDTILAAPVRTDWVRSGKLVEIRFDRCEFRCLINRADDKQESLTTIRRRALALKSSC